MFEVGDGLHYYAVDHSPSFLWNSATWENSEALLEYLPVVMSGPAAWDANETIRARDRDPRGRDPEPADPLLPAARGGLPSTAMPLSMRPSLWILSLLFLLAAAAPSASAAPRDVLYVGNNWDGTADVIGPALLPEARARSTSCRTRSSASRRSSSPDRSPTSSASATGRRGPRPVRRRHVLLPRRPLPLRLAAEPRRRRRLRPADREDRLALPGRGLPRRPHGDLARRPAPARLGLDRAQGPCHRHRAPAGASASSPPATSRTRTSTRATAG